MDWKVLFHEEFKSEFLDLSEEVHLEANCILLDCWNDMVQPYPDRDVDTLKGSSFSNMKELRFNADDGVWRVAFAFDPSRQAVLLVAGDKSGVNQKRFDLPSNQTYR